MSHIPKREAIMQALESRLNAQRVLPGYDARDLPITVIEAASESAEHNQYDQITATLPVTVARVISLNTIPEAKWHSHCLQQLTALYQSVFTDFDLNGLADAMRYTGSNYNPFAGEGRRQAELQLNLSIVYRFEADNPTLPLTPTP